MFEKLPEHEMTTPSGRRGSLFADGFLSPIERVKSITELRQEYSDRETFIRQIDEFFETHPKGLSEELVSRVIAKYTRFVMVNNSIKLRFHEELNEKTRLITHLKELKDELVVLKTTSKGKYEATVDRETELEMERKEEEFSHEIFGQVKGIHLPHLTEHHVLTFDTLETHAESKMAVDFVVDRARQLEVLLHKMFIFLQENEMRFTGVVWSVFSQPEMPIISPELADLLKGVLHLIRNLKYRGWNRELKNVDDLIGGRDEVFTLNKLLYEEAVRVARDLFEQSNEKDAGALQKLYLSVFPGARQEAKEWSQTIQQDNFILTVRDEKALHTELLRIKSTAATEYEGTSSVEGLLIAL
jgi:hypothetical protein